MQQTKVNTSCLKGMRAVSVMLDSGKKKKVRKKENKEPNQGCGFPGMETGQPALPLKRSTSAPLENTSKDPGLSSWWRYTGNRANPLTVLSFLALEHNPFSTVCLLWPVPETSSSLPSYLSTAVASVVDCRERETEASGTAQCREVAENPQKG